MKIFTTAALALLLTSGMAFAQDNSGSGNSGSGNDSAGSGGISNSSGNADGGANYLTGNGPSVFYTDESMTTLRPAAEMRSAWGAMSEQDRANAKQACSGNKDTRWSTFCNSIGSM
jgi:hypothetical protein